MMGNNSCVFFSPEQVYSDYAVKWSDPFSTCFIVTPGDVLLLLLLLRMWNKHRVEGGRGTYIGEETRLRLHVGGLQRPLSIGVVEGGDDVLGHHHQLADRVAKRRHLQRSGAQRHQHIKKSFRKIDRLNGARQNVVVN